MIDYVVLQNTSSCDICMAFDQCCIFISQLLILHDACNDGFPQGCRVRAFDRYLADRKKLHRQPLTQRSSLPFCHSTMASPPLKHAMAPPITSIAQGRPCIQLDLTGRSVSMQLAEPPLSTSTDKRSILELPGNPFTLPAMPGVEISQTRCLGRKLQFVTLKAGISSSMKMEASLAGRICTPEIRTLLVTVSCGISRVVAPS